MPNLNFKLIAKTIISISLVTFLLKKIDIASIKNLGWGFIIPSLIAIIIALFSIFLMSIRWKLLCLKFLNISPKTRILYRYYLIGSFFNIFLPGAIGGDVIRTRMLIKNYKISIKSASFVTISERILGLYGLIVLLCLGMLFRTFPEKVLFLSKISSVWIYLMIILIFLVFPITKYILSKRNINIGYKFMISTIIVLLIAQFGDIVIANIFIHYMNVEIPFTAVMFIMPLVYIATILPISLGGLGVREGTFAGLMLLYGVPTSTSVLISFSMYLVKVVVGIIGSFIFLKEKSGAN